MSSERDRIVSAISGGLIVAAAVGLLLLILGGCSGGRGESSEPCDWFALAAAPAGTPRPAAPPRPVSPDRLQKGRTAPGPTATASKSKRPARHHGDGFDLCD